MNIVKRIIALEKKFNSVKRQIRNLGGGDSAPKIFKLQLSIPDGIDAGYDWHLAYDIYNIGHGLYIPVNGKIKKIVILCNDTPLNGSIEVHVNQVATGTVMTGNGSDERLVFEMDNAVSVGDFFNLYNLDGVSGGDYCLAEIFIEY